MKLFNVCILASSLLLTAGSLEATIKLTEFNNQSRIQFREEIEDLIIDKEGKTFTSTDGQYRIIFEDADRSGYHRPHWKFNVWLQSKKTLPFFTQNKILYAVIFYDGLGEVGLNLDRDGKLNIQGGRNVKDILYPWAKGTIGRGNPYHEIAGTEVDDNGIVFFDYNGFVAYPENHFIDPELCQKSDDDSWNDREMDAQYGR